MNASSRAGVHESASSRAVNESAPDPDRARRTSSTTAFGELLLALREARLLTQNELAERMSQSTSYVSLLENGRRHPTRKVLAALKAALKLSAEEETRLTAAAGFPVDELGQAIQHVVDLILQQAPGEEADRDVVQADLTIVAKAWRDVLLGKQQVLAGNFYDADEHFTRMVTATELTPTLNASILLNAADVAEKRGDLARADDLIQRARIALEPLDEGRALPLRAEIEGMRGLIELRQGRYEAASKTMDRSRTMYLKLTEKDTDPTHQAIANVGLAKSYIRFALVSLLRGQPQQAERHCDIGEQYLAHVTQSPTDRHRLRLVGLRAWAYSKMPGRYADARRLHTQALHAYEELHDPYGIAKQQLYLGDDYRQEIESYLTEGIDDPDYERRRRRLRELLRPHKNLIDEAEDHYRSAIEGLERTQESIELSRALRSLGEILRYQGILHEPGQSQYREAIWHLHRALSIESEIGQGRRIPVTFESLAKLEWDHGALDSAANYFVEALSKLEDCGISSADPAGDALRRRCQVALDILRDASREVRLPESLIVPSVSTLEQTDSASRWRVICQAIVELITETLTLSRREPVSLSDLEPRWLGVLRDMEKKSGPRLIAQRQLCKTLSTALPPGYPAESAQLHAERCELFVKNIAEAQQQAGVGGYQDLCCRIAVERGVTNEFSGVLVRQQVKSALELLSTYRRAYTLDATIYDLPFGFAIKDRAVYLEVPARLLTSRGLVGVEGIARTSLLCYQIEDEPSLLQGLRDAFRDLVNITRQSTQRQDDTVTWLRRLSAREADDGDAFSAPVAVGSM